MKRRNFIKGAGGVIVGLPFLESLAYANESTKRFLVFFQCNGVNMEQFFPQLGNITAETLSSTSLNPLSGFAEKLLIPRGLEMSPRGWDNSNPGDDHSKGMGHKLTAMPLIEGSLYASGISIDQAIAKALNPNGREALHLQVGGDFWRAFGYISYTESGKPVRGQTNPVRLYEDLFGVPTQSMMSPGNEAADNTYRRRVSVLDVVREGIADLRRKGLSKEDVQKLDLHFTNIREIEKRLQSNNVCRALDPEVMNQLSSIDQSRVEHDEMFPIVTDLMIDLMVHALACGNQRVASLLLGRGSGGPIYTWDGMDHRYDHHKLSHGTVDDAADSDPVPGYQKMLADIDQWHAKKFARILAKLDGYTEGDGTVLDHTVCLWMNELSDGLAHSYQDMPIVMAGSAEGYLKTGISPMISGAPHNMLLTTIMNAMGIATSQFGQGRAGEISAIKS